MGEEIILRSMELYAFEASFETLLCRCNELIDNSPFSRDLLKRHLPWRPEYESRGEFLD